MNELYDINGMFSDLIEFGNFEACYAAASQNNLTIDQAELCDDGEYNCPDCPFNNIRSQNED